LPTCFCTISQDELLEGIVTAGRRQNEPVHCVRATPFIRIALTASRLLRIIGATVITRHDAVVSVRAGFAGRELSALWPGDNQWQLSEQSAGWFSHCFIAKRNE
jgi:hypothetical protein